AMREEDVYGRLRAVYRQLLNDPWNHIFVAQYPIAYPALPFYAASKLFVNDFDPWILEALATRLNQEIKRAVDDEAALARSQGKGDRLFIFSAPRFTIGAPGLPQVLGLEAGVKCPGVQGPADGVSHQSAATQSVAAVCTTEDPHGYWL